MSQVVTRFAPSPTGYLHIGGARTALFNWLYAKATGGKFLLRIEDTDRERSKPEAIDAILKGMRWLGLNWDGPHVSQFERAERHATIAHELVARGAAYYCFATREELDAMRDLAEKEKRPPKYNGLWRDADPNLVEAMLSKKVPYVIRLRIPQSNEVHLETVIDDLVQGRVVFQNEQLDDFILLRSDGTPTYMLAVVVDDHDMGVTHIIRGDDHLTNAARQVQIYKAMEWKVPIMAHIPLIHGPDGAKLSKRHGALGIEKYQEMGYLPEAMCNYLCRLGWSHGDDEFFSMEMAARWFDPSDINRGASRLDFKKLDHINGLWMRNTFDYDLVKQLNEIERLDRDEYERFLMIMSSAKTRYKNLVELNAGLQFLRHAPQLHSNERKTIDQDLMIVLPRVLDTIKWNVPEIENVVREYVEAKGDKLGNVASQLRTLLTGSKVSPPIFDVMYALGRDETLRRLCK